MNNGRLIVNFASQGFNLLIITNTRLTHIIVKLVLSRWLKHLISSSSLSLCLRRRRSLLPLFLNLVPFSFLLAFSMSSLYLCVTSERIHESDLQLEGLIPREVICLHA